MNIPSSLVGIQGLMIGSTILWLMIPVENYIECMLARLLSMFFTTSEFLNKIQLRCPPHMMNFLRCVPTFKQREFNRYCSVPRTDADTDIKAMQETGPAMTMQGTWMMTDYYAAMGDNVGYFLLPPADGIESIPVGARADSFAINGNSMYTDQAA